MFCNKSNKFLSSVKQKPFLGFSIIEIIVSILITGLVLSIFSSSFLSFIINERSQNSALAYSFAQTEIEALQNYTFESLTGRVDADFIGFAYNFGEQKITGDAEAQSPPQVLSVSPPIFTLKENVSSIVLLPESYYSDFIFSAYLKALPSSSSNWRTGIIFRYQDIENYYYFYISQNSLGLLVSQEGIINSLYSESRALSKDVWYNLKVSVSGSNIKIYLNDSLIYEISDSSFASGHLGLMGQNNTLYYVDSLHLESSIQNNDWNFDAMPLNSFPEDFLNINPVDLLNCQGKLTVEDYIPGEIKKIIVKVSWQEKGEDQEIKLLTLKIRE